MRPAVWFVHGWGFDASVFDALAEALSNPIPLGRQQRYDAGYAGAAVLEPPSEPFIAVAHSFGMMRVLKDLPPHCLGIVCLNGFARFSAAPDFTAGTPLRLIDRMLQRLRQDPMGVVNTFRARCGAEPYPVTTELDVDALFEDLSALRDDDARTALAACPAPVVAVAAEDDPIVPAGMTAMTFAHLSSVSVVLLPEGGHLLPVTHPAECADAVRRMAGSPNPAPAVANVNDLALPGSMP